MSSPPLAALSVHDALLVATATPRAPRFAYYARPDLDQRISEDIRGSVAVSAFCGRGGLRNSNFHSPVLGAPGVLSLRLRRIVAGIFSENTSHATGLYAFFSQGFFFPVPFIAIWTL